MRLPSIVEVTRSPAAFGALLVSLAPLAGVFLWGWKGGALVVLYWLENVVVGFVNVARMAFAGAAQGPVGVGAATFLIPFFCVHYGMFCFVHGIFVMALFADGAPTANLDPYGLVRGALAAAPNMAAIIGLIAVWKIILLLTRFIGGGEYRRVSVPEQMMAPYGRIVFVHIAIFAGAFALAALGQPIVGVVALVAVKATYDVLAEMAHDRRRRDASGLAKETVAPPPG